MAIDTKTKPIGTGQEGAGTPAGVNEENPVHIEGKQPVSKMDRLANRAARKGVERTHREDPMPFTK